MTSTPIIKLARKPHSDNPGYVAERKSKHPKLPGHFVIYDRHADPPPDIDADERWIVMHEPSSYHVSVPSLRVARDLMVSMAEGGNDADFGQYERRRRASATRSRSAPKMVGRSTLPRDCERPAEPRLGGQGRAHEKRRRG